MQYLEYNESKQRGTYDFPFEFYHIGEQHPQYVMSYHWHVEYEIIRILKGELRITLDEKEFLAIEGDTLFINSGILHFALPKDCIYECIVFDMNSFLKHNPSCKKSIQHIIDGSVLIFHQFSPKYKEVQSILWHVFDAMRNKKTGYELITFGELYHFFGLIYEKNYYLANVPQTRRDYKRINQFKHVLELIESSYGLPLTLDQLSAAANMSPKYFCRFFFDMTHKRPMDYLNHHRIEHACYQLTTTDESVTNIALNCGFNDLSYFIKTFKKYKGVTPGQYTR